jgi:putative flippase GtrA
VLGFLSVLGFNFAVLPLLVEVFGWPVLLSQLVLVTVTAAYSWFAHRGFSFRRNPPKLGLLEHRRALS